MRKKASIFLGIIILMIPIIQAGWPWEVVIGGTLVNDNPARLSKDWHVNEAARFKIPTYQNYYTAVAVVNNFAGHDFDLFLFNDYAMEEKISTSTLPANEIDVAIIDTREWGSGYKFGLVAVFAGNWNQGIQIEADSHGGPLARLPDPDTSGPVDVGTTRTSEFEDGVGYTSPLSSGKPLINMYDVYLHGGGTYHFRVFDIQPSITVKAYLLKGSCGLHQNLVSGSGSPIQFDYSPTETGWYGFLVTDENEGQGVYKLLVYSDFTMSSTPSSKLIAPGMSATYNITIDSKGVVTPIDLSYTWIGAPPPTGTSVTFSADPVVPSGVMSNYSTLTITTPSSGFPPGTTTYTLRVYGDDVSDSPLPPRYTDVKLVVSTNPDFYLSPSPTYLSVSPGNSAVFIIDIDTINGFTSPVTLSAVSSPSEPTIQFGFSPNPVNPTPGNSTLTVFTTSATPTTTYTITITGQSGTLTRTATATLRVNPPMKVEIISPKQNDVIAGVHTFKVLASTTSPNYITDVFLKFGGVMAPAGTVATYYNSNSGYWETDINTNAYNDGFGTVNVTAVDAYGGTTTVGPRQFYVSNTAPNPVIVEPLDRDFVTGGNVNIKVNTTLNVNLVQFRIDTNAFQPLIGGPPTWTGTWNSLTTTDGPHTLTVRAKNTAGLVGDTSITIYVDNKPPTCYIAVPIKEQFVGGMFTFRVFASDIVAIDHVNLTVFGATVPTALNTQTGYYEYTVGTTLVNDGMYTVNATAYDKVGHTVTSADVTFYVDNNPPSLKIITPGIEKIVNGSNYLIKAESEDENMFKVEYRVDATSWVAMTGPQPVWTSIFNSTAFPDGPHTITFKAIDNASHITEQSFMFYIDNTRPTCTITAPIKNDFVSGYYTFKIASVDIVGVDRVDVSVFGSTGTATYNYQTGYYEYIVNTITHPDGLYNITAIAYDKSGKSTKSSPIQFKLDNNPPVLTVNSPISGTYVNKTVKINVTAVDAFPAPINYTMYNVDNTGWVNTNIVWDTTNVSDGSHEIKIMATDEAGHTTRVTINVIVDNNLPVCAINSPIKDQFIEDVFTFKATASDYVGIDRVLILVFNTTITMAYNSDTGYYEYTTDTTTRSDGIYDAKIVAYDKSGQISSAGPITFRIDNRYPKLSIISPTNGDLVHGDVEINVSVDDIFLKLTEYNVDGSGWVATSIQWNTTYVSDGKHNISIRAIDMIGHITQQTITVWVDNNPPTCTITSPAPEEFIQGVYTFRIIAKDIVGISRVNLTISWAPHQQVSAAYNILTGYYEYSVNTVTWTEDGVHNVTAVAYDRIGRTATVGPIEFKVDNNPPILTINHPKEGEYVSDIISIQVNVSDAFPGPIRYNIDGSGWIPTSIPWNTRLVADGVHEIIVKAIDQAGHETKETIKVVVDNTVPQCSIVSPNVDEYVQGTYVFRVAAFDHVGVAYVELYILNRTIRIEYNSETGYYEYTLNTFGYEDDEYFIKALAKDTSDKLNATSTLRFFIDNKPPCMKILSPLPTQIVSGIISVNASATDRFLKSIEYNIDNTGWLPINTTWDTKKVGDGEHTILVRAIDHANHQTQQSINVIVDNIEPVVSVQHPTENAHINGVYTVKVYADDIVDVASVSISIDDSPPVRLPRASIGKYYEYNVDTTKLKDGVHTIVVTALDFANHKTEKILNVFVDNTGPEISINYTKEGTEREHGRVIFVVRVKDLSDVRIVYLNIDNTGWRQMVRKDNVTYSYVWPTTEQIGGMHIYQIRAIDELGNEAIHMGEIYIEHKVPPDYLKLFLDILPLIVFVFFVILFTVVVILRRFTGRWIWEPKMKKKSGVEDTPIPEMVKKDDEIKEREREPEKNTKIRK